MELEKMNEKLSRCKEAKYMVFSSCFFLYPIYHGLCCQIYGHSILLFVCFLASVNYWRNPVLSLRRDIDIIISKLTMIVYIVNAFRFVRQPIYVIFGFPNMVLFLYVFRVSTLLFNENKTYWWKYHILFHFLCSFNQYILLDELCLLHNFPR
jgi:hypothetical protein